MLSALGVRFYDAKACELKPGGLALRDLDTIDLYAIDPRLQSLDVAAYIDKPLCGEHGASFTFGRQKGVSAEVPPLVIRLLLSNGR